MAGRGALSACLWRWRVSVGEVTGHMLDYVIVSHNFTSSFLDTHVYQFTYGQ